jgi:hypothetical protein
MPRRRTLLSLLLAPLVVAAACSKSTSPPPPRSVIILNGQNEDLVAYDSSDPTKKQVLISGGETEKVAGPSSVNGEICFDPSGSRRFIMADDNLNPNPPNHFALFQLKGDKIGELSVTKLLHLTPTYQKEVSGYGCGFLADGRALTTDTGNTDTGPGNGQLVLWFPPFDPGGNSHYCKLDITIATAGQIVVDEQDRIYVTSARLEPGVYRYTGPFPTGDDAAHGCGKRDSTGAPLADHVNRERFLMGDQTIQTPVGLARTRDGSFVVSSVLNGVIAEYDRDGKFVRRLLQPPAGERIGKTPYSTGTPFGLEVDSQGTIYYADLGLVLTDTSIDIGMGMGSVRKIAFKDGEPQPPETMDLGLSFPDGIGVLEVP